MQLRSQASGRDADVRLIISGAATRHVAAPIFMKILTLHRSNLEVHEERGHLFITPEHPTGYVMFFRGGTGSFGVLTLSYLFKFIVPFVEATGFAVLAPEYGEHDEHGGEPDLAACDDARSVFSIDRLQYVGGWGVSRGCTEAWLFHQRHPEVRSSPLVMWCPVFDYVAWLKERPDVQQLFDRKGIVDLERRSASHANELKTYASRFLVLGASEDQKVLVHHAEQFAKAAGGSYASFKDAHGFPEFTKGALEQTERFFLGSRSFFVL